MSYFFSVYASTDSDLISVHTLFLCEHNRLCGLVGQHPDWNDEHIYQTVKLISAKLALISNSYRWLTHTPTSTTSLVCPNDDGDSSYRIQTSLVAWWLNLIKRSFVYNYLYKLNLNKVNLKVSCLFVVLQVVSLQTFEQLLAPPRRQASGLSPLLELDFMSHTFWTRLRVVHRV
jgi:hypothetical protein